MASQHADSRVAGSQLERVTFLVCLVVLGRRDLQDGVGAGRCHETSTGRGKTARRAGPPIPPQPGARSRPVLEQAAVGVPEVHVLPGAAGDGGSDRPVLDLDVVALEVRDSFLDRSRPDQAQVAVAGCDGHRRAETLEAGPVRVQLPLAEAS